MNLEAEWLSEIRQLTNRISTIFITGTEFTSVIDSLLTRPNCPLSGLLYEILCPPPFGNQAAGRSVEGSPDVQTIQLEDNRQTQFRIKKWAKDNMSSLANRLDRSFEDLFKSYWKSNLRTQSAGMFDLKRVAEATEFARRTVEGCRLEGKHCALLFADLDNFKMVNDQISHEEGNRVIKEFGAALESICKDKAILLHNGGDEFVALIPGGGGEEVVILAYEIWSAVRKYDFHTSGIELGVSCGLASTDEDKAKDSFDGLLVRADQALNDYGRNL